MQPYHACYRHRLPRACLWRQCLRDAAAYAGHGAFRREDLDLVDHHSQRTHFLERVLQILGIDRRLDFFDGGGVEAFEGCRIPLKQLAYARFKTSIACLLTPGRAGGRRTTGERCGGKERGYDSPRARHFPILQSVTRIRLSIWSKG